MPSLDRALRNLQKEVEKETMMNLNDSIKNNTSGIWKGKKVVSVAQWKVQRMGYDKQKFWSHLPDEYLYPVYFFKPENEEEKKKISKWFKDFVEFLRVKKSPSFGRAQCDWCILNPANKIPSTSIREIILKHNHLGRKYPCDVINYFKCPYKKSRKNIDLFGLGEIWRIIHNSLVGASRVEKSEKSTIYEANYETGFVEQYLLGSPKPVARFPLYPNFRDVLLSMVKISCKKDVFDILTSKELLEKILDQQIKIAENDTLHFGQDKSETERVVAEIMEWKERIVEFFAGIECWIKPEDIGDLWDGITDEKVESFGSQMGAGNPNNLEKLKEKNQYCVTCDKFSNIHCVNCDVWVCDEHWEKHGLEIHKKKIS